MPSHCAKSFRRLQFLGEFWVKVLNFLEITQKYSSKKFRKMREIAYFCVLFRIIVHSAGAHNPKVVGSNPSSATKKSRSSERDFFIQAAGLAYHPPSGGISSTTAMPWLYIITAPAVYNPLLLDDIQPFRADDMQGCALICLPDRLGSFCCISKCAVIN